jgi:uncharacterized protein (TIGR02646 family)
VIYVKRSRTAPPQLLATAAREMAAYQAYLVIQTRRRRRRRAPMRRQVKLESMGFEFKAYRLDAVKQHLEAAFHSKCAYCDSDYSVVAVVQVEHFRPKGRVDREGLRPLSGYYWLAGEWSNLLPSCGRCNSRKRDFIPALNRVVTVGKANWFPLWDEGKRATGPGDETKEYPLLLNPCRDNPEKFLAFDADGMVEPAPGLGRRDLAKATSSIHILGLGRKGLVDARRDYARRVLGQIQRIEENYQDWRAARGSRARAAQRLCREWDELEGFLQPNAPYQAVTRRLIASRIKPSMRRDIAKLRR